MGRADEHRHLPPLAVADGDTDNPDELRIDLDPQPGTDFADAVPAAHALREVLAEPGLTAWVKTSGNRGLHVFATIRPTHEFLDVRHAVIAVARELERRMPEQGHDRLVEGGTRRADLRRLQPGQPRPHHRRRLQPAALPGATGVHARSAGTTWTDVDPRDFTVRTVPDRLQRIGDPWAGMHGLRRRPIDALLELWERDVAAGLGELPFPPDYPKMPGEPPRVQPSRARKDA